MNDIKVYENEQFGQIRVDTGHDGEPWFVASDVCQAIGLDTSHVRRGLDDDEVSILPNWQGKGMAPLIVSEAGLYSLILRSRKPEARDFRRWVTHEVLPTIRKTGGYIAARQDEAPEEIMARALVIAQDTIERQKRRLETAQAELDESRPKALFADAVSASSTSILVGDLAKLLKQNGFETGAKRLFARLRDEGFLIKREGSDWNMPTQRSMEQGLFEIKETAITHSDGHVTINKTPKVTGKGQVYFVNRYCGQAAV